MRIERANSEVVIVTTVRVACLGIRQPTTPIPVRHIAASTLGVEADDIEIEEVVGSSQIETDRSIRGDDIPEVCSGAADDVPVELTST